MGRFNKTFTKAFVDGVGRTFVNGSSSRGNDGAHYKFTKEKPGMEGFLYRRKN